QWVIGVVAGLGRQIEGDRQAGLSLGEVLPVELVRGFGRRMAGVGAHEPGALALLRRCLRHGANSGLPPVSTQRAAMTASVPGATSGRRRRVRSLCLSRL